MSLWVAGDDLAIQVEHGHQVSLQTSGSTRLLPLRGRVQLPRRGVAHVLHLGTGDRTHDVWRFKW